MTEGKKFSDLNLSEARLAAVEALGWTSPTPIQEKCIPVVLDGKDVVGIAQTGTGKTGGFMIPTLEQVTAGGGLQALVLCPTRELAQQVADDTVALAKGTNLRCEAIYGGVKYGPQVEALERGFEVIAATPGRFMDHLQRKNADLSSVRFLILDEADRMLDMGFRPQIEQIMRTMPRKRQTMLFSATMPNGVHALALRITRDAAWLEAAPEGTAAEGISQVAYFVKPSRKPDLLLELLSEEGWDQVLIFTRTKRGADSLDRRLEKAGIKADVMHSDRQMRHRTRALDRFANGEVRVLVATDIAQRGLDVEGISHVVNYDIPLDPEDYVHRIGRTGRAGATGTAVTFVTAGDLGSLKSLEYRLGHPLDRIHLPEYDYAGTSMRETKKDEPKTRSPRGMGSRKGQELTPEELAALLKFD